MWNLSYHPSSLPKDHEIHFLLPVCIVFVSALRLFFRPYSAQVIRSSKKPQSKSESFVRFTDEHNQQFQIESKYVAAIKPPPPNPDGDKTTGNAKYQIILTEDNKYQVKVAYTPEMPERVTQRYYLIKRMDGRDLTIPHVYVLKIDPMTKKDLYDEPDPQFIDRFDYR
jgi:hypothetical protein